MAANQSEMGDLHKLTCDTLKAALEYKYVDENGNPTPPPPHVLKSALEFLKNNRIEADPTNPNSPAAGLLQAALPHFEDMHS